MNVLKNKISNFRQNRFIKDVAVLESGTMAGNFLNAVVGIFLARLLQPELFGIYALAMSLASVFAIFLGIGAQEAIVTVLGEEYAKGDKKEIKNALGFLIKITVITGLIVLVGAFFAPLIAKFFYGDFRIGAFAAIVIVASVISSSLFSISRIILQVGGKIKQMTILGFGDQLIRSVLSLTLVILGFGVLGAVTGHLIGAIIVFIASFLVWEAFKKENKIFPSIRSLIKTFWSARLKKYLGFSVWIAIDRNIGMLFVILPVALTGIFVSASEVTFFKLAFGYLNLALGFLGPISTLLNVEFPKIKVEENGKLAGSFTKISFYSLGLSALLVLGAVIVSPIAFKVLYGQAFMPSVKYVFGLFIYGALMGMGVGLGPMWRAINKVKVSILINTIVLGAGIPLGLWLIKTYGLWGSVIMVTFWFTVSHLVSFIYLRKKLKTL